jgi:GNAT superfamily N-acetyltransferase
MEFAWRAMTARDIDRVVAVARAAFPDHFEARACFEERLGLFAQGCFVLASDGAVKGYLIAYPWEAASVPPLNSLVGSLPETRELFYLHDLALHPDVRGQGHARPIVERLAHDIRSQGARRIALVSVNDTLGFWRTMGFRPVTAGAAITRKLESYGEGSTYMVREL